MSTKSETALLLRDLGFSYMEIAAELYPEDYKRYLRTRDPKLRALLKKRVWKLLRLARGGSASGDEVAPQGGWTQDDLEDSGGERDPLEYRSPLVLRSPSVRKAGKKGAERQVIEYEQFLYRHYKESVEQYDRSGVIWATARFIHGRAFRDYYEKYRVNVWGAKSARSVARTYAYAVLSTAVLLHGLYHLRFYLERELEPDKEVLKEILPIVFAHVL